LLLLKEKVALIFKGMDTYAEVCLNDDLILNANNMFREWEIECKDLLNEGSNKLEIKFRNVFDENIPKWEEAPFRLLAHPVIDQADVIISMYYCIAQFHYGWGFNYCYLL
jgi:beta-mannosidase